jgi:hypothetical protein
VKIGSLSQALWFFAPLFLIAFSAGALRAAALRQAQPERRRLYQVLWVLVLLVGTPLWLFAAATFRLI